MFRKVLEFVHKTSYNPTDVCIFAMQGNVDELVKALEQHDNSTNWHKDVAGCTALHRAAESGQLKCVEILLDKGIDVNACNNYDWTAIHYAAGNGHKECVNLLLNRGSKVNHKINDGRTALFRASSNGSVECIEILLNWGADINSCNNSDKTALHEASKWGHHECVRILIDHGAEINKNNIDIYKPHSNYRNDCRPMILAEVENRTKRFIFDSFIKRYIEYQPYINSIYIRCFPKGNLRVAKPTLGWIKSEAIKDSYYLEEVFFYLHFHIANIYANKRYKGPTTNLMSKSTGHLINNSNTTSTLMTILTDRLKVMLLTAVVDC